MQRLYRNLGLLLVLAFVVLGSSYAFLLPPFHVPDERRHWLAALHRMSRLATGSGVVCSTDVALDRHFQVGVRLRREQRLPSGIFARVEKLSPSCEKRLQYREGNALSYPGVLLSRLFVSREPTSGRESLFAFYLARLLHGVIITLLLFRLWWLARASTTSGPSGLLLLLLFSLSPLFLQQSFGITNDVVVNAFALTLCTWLIFTDRLAWFDTAAFVAFGTIAALTKPLLAAVLLLVLATGLFLQHVRGSPDRRDSLVQALAKEFTRRRAFGVAVIAISVVGVVYIFASGDLRGTRKGAIDAAKQLEFATAQPWHVFQIIARRIGEIFASPSSFLSYLGYTETHLSEATVRQFAQLAFLTGVVEAVVGGRSVVRMARDRAQREALRRAWVPMAVLAGSLLAIIGISILMIGFRAYLVASWVGDDRLFGVSPRYFFPYLAVSLALVVAIARTFFGGPREPREPPPLDGEGMWHLAEAAVLMLFAVNVVSFASHLSIDLLQRYS